MSKILITGFVFGCELFPILTQCAEQGIEVEVRKSPPVPEPLVLEFKVPVIKSIGYQPMFIPPSPRPWERKKKGQRR